MGCGGHNYDSHGERLNDIVKEYHDSKEKGKSCKLFENPVFDTIFGGAIRPGGLNVTKRAMELCNFKNGAKILDVGCGYGVTVKYLQSNYEVEAIGIDLSASLLEKGKSRNPELDLVFGDGEMLDFPSLFFDGVFMECALSLMDNKTEALHEAYCVLKKGGKLVISDFYLKEKQDAPSTKTKPFKSCINGASEPEELENILSDLGFKVLYWEDKNKELKEFTASIIMHYGSIDAFLESTHEDEDESVLSGINNTKKVGYHLLIAEKQ